MELYALGVLAWLVGVLFSLVVSMLDHRFESRYEAEDALREALIWFLVLLPWREWLRSGTPGRHRSVVAK